MSPKKLSLSSALRGHCAHGGHLNLQELNTPLSMGRSATRTLLRQSHGRGFPNGILNRNYEGWLGKCVVGTFRISIHAACNLGTELKHEHFYLSAAETKECKFWLLPRQNVALRSEWRRMTFD